MKVRSHILTPFARGRATHNVKAGSNILDVFLEEFYPTIDGELVADKTTIDSAGYDADGKPYTASIKVGYGVEASWLREGNRVTRPDVRRGERIIVYRAMDSDIYFWRPTGEDQNFRRLETVTWLFSANPSNDDQDEPNYENSYLFEVSTHQGKITLSTTQLNNEQAAFFAQLNTMRGVATFNDEKGNYVTFDSVNTFYEMYNVDKTRITVSKKLIDIFAEDSIHFETTKFSIQANESIYFNATDWFKLETKDTTINSSNSIAFSTKDYTLKAGNSVTVEAGSTISEKTNRYSMQASSWTVNASTATINAPSIGLNGMVSVSLGMSVSGPTSGSTSTFQSTATQSLTASSISAGTISGGSVTGCVCC